MHPEMGNTFQEGQGSTNKGTEKEGLLMGHKQQLSAVQLEVLSVRF